MVQTISSLFIIILLAIKIYCYLPPAIQPFTAKAPIRRFEARIEYSTFELVYPLKLTADKPLKEESTFFKPPFQSTLYKDLSAL